MLDSAPRKPYHYAHSRYWRCRIHRFRTDPSPHPRYRAQRAQLGQTDLRRQPRSRWPAWKATRAISSFRPTSPIVSGSARRCWTSSRTPSCIWPPNPTSIAPSTARPNSFRPTSSAPTSCWRPPAPTGRRCRPSVARRSASTTSPPMRCTATCTASTTCSPRPPYAPSSPYSASKASSDHWSGPGSVPTACRC